MLNKPLFFKLLCSVLVAYSGIVFSEETTRESNVKKEIIRLLREWPQDFNAKKIQAVCGLFAPDLIASYFGTEDKNYEEMCSRLSAAMTNSDKIFQYETPQIDQILIDKELAVVRLVWTLKIFDKNQSAMEVIKENGLDVFKRQKNGSWKVAISYAYPITNTVNR